MENRSARFVLGLAATLLLLGGPTLQAQGEYPQTAFANAPFAGTFCSDMSWDPVTNRLFAADLSTGITYIYNSTLGLIGNIPSVFPAGSVVTGVATAPVTGQLFWSVFNGAGAADLWSAPNAATPATLVGPIMSFSSLPLGIDCDSAFSNIIYTNDFGIPFMSAIDYTGAFGGFCQYPGTASTGIAHRIGTFVEVTTDALGVGVTTHFSAMDLATCTALDNVGVPVYFPGLSIWSFDYGPFTPTQGRTLYLYESVTNSITHVSMHRSSMRGDADNDTLITNADANFIIAFLFGAGPAPGCFDAADADDSGAIGIGDATLILAFVAGTGPAPPAPNACGYDPTPDPLRCDFSLCP